MENRLRDNKQFFKFYHDIIVSSTWAKLSLAAKAVYPVIARYTNHKTGESFPSLSTISKYAGLHRESVVNAINDLINAGLIIKRKGGGRISNVYQLVYFYQVVGLSDSSSNVIRPHKSSKQTAPVRLSNTNYININKSNITISKDNVITNISIEKEIVDSFYSSLNLKASKVKRERGYGIVKDLLGEGYKDNELRFASRWACDNVKDINSFSIVPHIIDQAIKASKKEKHKNRLNIKQEEELLMGRKKREERLREQKYLEKIKTGLSQAELASIEKEARAIILKEQGITKGPGYNICLQMKVNGLISKKYLNRESLPLR